MGTKFCENCSSLCEIAGGRVISRRNGDGQMQTKWNCKQCALKALKEIYSKSSTVIKPAPPPLIDVLPQEKARFSGFFLYKIASP